MSTRIALLLSVILAIVAAVGVRAWMENEKANNAKKVKLVPVMAAKKALKVGDILDQEKVSYTMIAKNGVVAGMIHADEYRKHLNLMITKPIPKGEPIFIENLTDKIDAPTRTDIVKEGMRAVTIRVDQVSGVAYLARPGDYVDVVGTFDVEIAKSGGGGPAGKEKEQRTVCLLESAKLLAVDNRTKDLNSASRKNISTPYRSVTLEVSPVDGVRLINAEKVGRLHLMLRSRLEPTSEILKKGTQVRWDKGVIQGR